MKRQEWIGGVFLSADGQFATPIPWNQIFDGHDVISSQARSRDLRESREYAC
jgi:hypothetical protein